MAQVTGGSNQTLQVETFPVGQLRVFDNHATALTANHILASCSILLVYPWTKVGACHYRDGAVLAEGYGTKDILEEGAKLIGTREMGDRVAEKIGK